MVLKRGMRIGVLGANGCGKTTLLRSIWGKLPLLSGMRKPGQRVRMGVFTQDLAADLPLDESPLEWITTNAPTTPPEKIAHSRRTGSTWGYGTTEIGPVPWGTGQSGFSGHRGESVQCAAFRRATNHLDTETIDGLIDGLRAFEGTLISSVTTAILSNLWRVMYWYFTMDRRIYGRG